MKRPRKFCSYQVVCREDRNSVSYSCLSRLDEARVFECPYEESDIKMRDEYREGRYRFVIQRRPRPNADGICRDFKITSRVRKDLIEKMIMGLEKF